jgi:hypothetical protein
MHFMMSNASSALTSDGPMTTASVKTQRQPLAVLQTSELHILRPPGNESAAARSRI